MASAVTREKLDSLIKLGLSVPEAARCVGVGRTLFKKICRRNGIMSWPKPALPVRLHALPQTCRAMDAS